MRLAGRNWSGHISSTSPRCFLRCRRRFILRSPSLRRRIRRVFSGRDRRRSVRREPDIGLDKEYSPSRPDGDRRRRPVGRCDHVFRPCRTVSCPHLLFLGAAGFFDMISGIFRGSIWNQTIPNYLRGRLASIEMMSYLTGPMLGSAKMGIVAEKFGVKAALVSGGGLCVVAVIGAAVFLPKFLAVRRPRRRQTKGKRRSRTRRVDAIVGSRVLATGFTETIEKQF